MQGLMHGKRGLIMGVANDHSIAWGIARTLAAHGARLSFTYQGDSLGKRVKPLAASVKADLVLPCDVEDVGSVDKVFAEVGRAWGTLDFLVHAIAFSDKTQLTGRYADSTRENFLRTMLISCFAFTEAAKRAAALMSNGGAMLTLTYNGGQRAMPNYNAMESPRRRWRLRCAISPRIWARRRSGSTPSLPGRSRRWPSPASPTAAISSNGTNIILRCGAT